MTCGEEVVSRNVTCEMENLKNVTAEMWKIFEKGRISKAAGGAQVTRCSANKYNPPMSLTELIRLVRCGLLSSCGFI